MTSKTRKRLWPVSLVMAMAVVGVVAAFLMMASSPANTQAHDGVSGSTHCDDLGFIGKIAHDEDPNNDHDCETGPAATATPPPTIDPTPEPMPAMVTSSSTTGSATVELKLTVTVDDDVPVGGAFVLYLEDDYQEPDSISASDVYFVVTPADSARADVTGNGARVYATQNPEIDTDDHFTKDKKDIDIRVSLPDLCSIDTPDCQGQNGLMDGDMVTMVIQKSAGIKNPPEEGSHSTGYLIIGPADAVPGSAAPDNQPFNVTDVLRTWAKVGISDVDNSRGYEMTVTGTGFNNGTSAAAYVLATSNIGYDTARWWETLDCAGMKTAAKAFGLSGDNTYCFHFDLGTDMSYTLNTSSGARGGHADFMALTAEEKQERADNIIKYGQCATIVEFGTKVGDALVGSDDKVTVTFEVTAPTFKPGNVNYICMVDGEGRASNRDVEDFKLEPSIKVVPSSVSSGDTVNVFAQDFPAGTGGFAELKIGGMVLWATGADNNKVSVNAGAIRPDGSDTATFKVPGGLEGVLRIDAKWGSVNEDSKITITGGELNPSKTDVMPNETITVSGNGFGTQTCIPFSNITLDNTPVMVHPDSNSEDCAGNAVKVSNSGQFVATVIIWPAASGGTNPTLIPGTHELEFEDTSGFSSSVSLTIEEPVITVAPDIAGPRDYITIMGENWPVDNLDNTLNNPVTVCVEDFGSGERCNGRSYPVYADAVGRFTVEHRVHRRVAIPDTVQVKATYADVAKVGSFAVPASTVDVTPGEGQPGDMVTLSAGNMPVYTEVDYIEIGGTRYDDPGVNTDRDGNVTVEDVLIPGLDPGTYSVVVNVDGTIAIGEVSVLAESSARGAPAELPGAVEALGDSLVAIFHFDDVGKTWSFYDPRPEFSDLNTLTEMVNGEAYWILVSDTMEDVVLNNKVRSLTCRGDDCWNLEVW
ncbi:MAG: hypothetical protein OXU28_12695 [Chloroflexota bacterium]|nr:hypothetical protein [Chloroflexota bacterium]